MYRPTKSIMLCALTLVPGILLQATVGAPPLFAQEAVSEESVTQKLAEEADNSLQVATFGGGCFWCVEAVFENLAGVEDVVSGYSGGGLRNPTYKQVLTKRTGHIEVCQITFDPKVISYRELLEVFWKTHDPTTKDAQGNDKGPQYRSVIFFHNEEQKKIAEYYKQQLDQSGAFEKRIVTVIREAPIFWKAEDYHQDYYRKNPNAGYCSFVVRPKVEKFKQAFAGKLKE